MVVHKGWLYLLLMGGLKKEEPMPEALCNSWEKAFQSRATWDFQTGCEPDSRNTTLI